VEHETHGQFMNASRAEFAEADATNGAGMRFSIHSSEKSGAENHPHSKQFAILLDRRDFGLGIAPAF
jgi:hypothetical protein